MQAEQSMLNRVKQSYTAYRAARLCFGGVVACRALVCPSPISPSLCSFFPLPLTAAGRQGRWYPSKQNDPGVPAPCFDPAALIVQA